jgi:spore coat polysaccharide biosynthesis protein SpsF
MTLLILQARMGSSRLPGKVLAPILDRPMILHLIERIRGAQTIDKFIVATTVKPQDDELVDVLAREGVEVRRGPSEDVLGRFLQVIDEFEPTTFVRLTGDNPFVDATTVDRNVEAHLAGGGDYTTNGLSRRWPHGLNVEVAEVAALRRLAAMELTDSEHEHVTIGMLNRPDEFGLVAVPQERDVGHLRWTVDYPEDFAWARQIFEILQPQKPLFGQQDVLDLLEQRPELVRTSASAQLT